MADTIIYKGRGNAEMYDDYMDFINYVFGFNGNEQDFKKLLPKLYNPECDPCYNNYVVTENGKLKAAIGAFDSEVTVGGEVLKCRGIGNVAVHPYSRSKGYMIDCMNMALSDMVKDGVDYSILGGQRQRYNYFGFDYIGVEYHVDINGTNLRHCFRDVPFTELVIRDVKSDESELIDKIYGSFCTRPMRTLRPRDRFYDICVSWRTPLRAIFKNGEYIGYFVGDLQELTLNNPEDFDDVVRNYVRNYGSVEIRIPDWREDLLARATRICGGYSVGHCDMFNVFSYKRFVGAFLEFEASYKPMCDGTLTVLIHGFAGDEKLKITTHAEKIGGRYTTVEEYDGECELELSHRDAMAFFFSLSSPYRTKISPAIRAALPIPVYIENADHV